MPGAVSTPHVETGRAGAAVAIHAPVELSSPSALVSHPLDALEDGDTGGDVVVAVFFWK
jgi:hypothetical protein